MKKLLMVLMISFLLIGIVSAQGEVQGSNGEEKVSEDVALYSEPGAKMMKPEGEFNGEPREGNEFGETVRLSGEGDRVRLQAGNYSVNCEGCNLSQEMKENKLMIKAKLSNGRNAEIKVMPNTASETALNRLRLKVCAENCTIELKEVGNGNETRLAYKLNATKDAKVFGLFKAKANVEAQVDAETGEVITSKKPWWLAVSSTED